jgi:hypothetical protein
MFFVGKTENLEAAEEAGGHLPNLWAYPSDDDCIWVGWDSEGWEELDSESVRLALVMTLARELSVEFERNGVSYKVPDPTVRSIVDSITGKGPMWWKKHGHSYVRQTSHNAKGFA